MTKKVTFYFVRHGETYLNKYERMQGWSNAPLTPNGIVDCIASGKGLANVKFDAVYTSDLQRTKDTALLILAENKVTESVELIEKPEFREVFFGSFEGLPSREVWPKVLSNIPPEEIVNGRVLNKSVELNSIRAMDPTHDAEDYKMFWTRVEKGLYDLLAEHKNSDANILVVSHGMTLATMMQGLIPDFKLDGYLLNASVSILRYEAGRFHMDALNQVDHFDYTTK